MTRRPVSILGTLLHVSLGSPGIRAGIRAAGQPATDPPAHISVVDGTAVLERDGRTRRRTARPCRCSPAIACAREAGRVEMLFADGSALHLDEHTIVDFQSDEVVRLLDGRRAAQRPGPVARDRVSHRRAVGLGADQQPGRVSRRPSCGATTKSSSRSCAAARSSSTNRDAATCRPASAPTPRAGRAVARLRLQFGGVGCVRSLVRSRAAISGSACPPSICPKTCGAYAPAFDTYGSWRHEPAYGYVWYPRVQVGWRPYYHGRWVEPAALWLDVDRERSLGMADAPLRPLGHLRRRRGSGFPGDRGRRRGSRGGTRQATSAGVRSAGTTGRFSASR